MDWPLFPIHFNRKVRFACIWCDLAVCDPEAAAGTTFGRLDLVAREASCINDVNRAPCIHYVSCMGGIGRREIT